MRLTRSLFSQLALRKLTVCGLLPMKRFEPNSKVVEESGRIYARYYSGYSIDKLTAQGIQVTKPTGEFASKRMQGAGLVQAGTTSKQILQAYNAYTDN